MSDTIQSCEIMTILGYPCIPYNGVAVWQGVEPSAAIKAAVALIPMNLVTANLNNVSGLSAALSSDQKAALNRYQKECVKTVRKTYTGTGPGSLEELMEGISDCLEAGNPVNPAHMSEWLSDRQAVKASIPLPPPLT